MARKLFAFTLGQRINVPGQADTQGVVSLPRLPEDFAQPAGLTGNEGPLFFVIWVAPSGDRGFAWFTTGELESGIPIALPVSKAMRKLRRRRRARRAVRGIGA